MDPAQNSGDGSGKSREVVEDLPFQEIRCLMAENEPASQNGSSFTALLGLPANQAMELLHEHEAGHPQAEIWRVRGKGQNPLDGFPFDCFPTFPSNPELVERAARFSVFAAEDSSPQTTSSGRSNSGVYLAKAVKTEPAESDSNPNSSAGSKPQQPRPPKRKELEKSKAKGSAKRAKSSVESGVPKPAEGNNGGEKEKLPYVHVRARRGQATDSHSLAERARREKINARMKLLQELVPGCNKISGTAQVLDEIINHVQSLQRQVEFLSMRLAAVNPRIDFSGLDSFLAASGRIQEANAGSAPGLVEQPSMWSDAHRQQQIWLADLVPTPHSYSSSPPPLWGRDDAEHHQGLVPPGSSLFGYDSINPVALHGNQLKQEI